MPTGQSAPSTAWGACTKIVEAATKACSPVGSPSAPAEPNWDAMAASFAALSNALTWGSIILGVIAFLSAFAWGKQISKHAEAEARRQAKASADELIGRWLRDEAPGLIRSHLDNLQKPTLGDDEEGNAADKMGQMAG